MGEDKNIKDMTREELEIEVVHLRTQYIWGLEPEDFAAAGEDMWPEDTVIYSQEEFSNDALRTKLFDNHKNCYFMENWTDDVFCYQRDSFTQEDWNIIATMKERNLIYNSI